jgi:YesN/AraC family two-component response regulator
LIVDDEEIIRTATKNAIKNLDKEKYLIFEAENGLVALDLFTKLNQSKSDSNIDLIFTDI